MHPTYINHMPTDIREEIKNNIIIVEGLQNPTFNSGYIKILLSTENQ